MTLAMTLVKLSRASGNVSFTFDDDLSDTDNSDAEDDAEEDVTAWRAGDEECEDADPPAIDGRVADAFEALNEAIAQNNELEAAHSAAVRALEEQKHAAHEQSVSKQQARQLRRVEKFREEQAAANRAATALRQAEDALSGAREILQCASEALELQRDGASSEQRKDADWKEAEAVLEARRAAAARDVRTHVAERKRCAAELERRTRRIVEKTGTLGDAVGEALVPLATQASSERQLARAEETVRATAAETAKAKASVKEAMQQLENISLDIQQQQQQHE